MAAVLIYFRADLWRIAVAWLARAAGAVPPAQPRGEAGLVHRPRHDPDLDLRLRLQGPDRVGRPQPLPDRLGADPLLLRDAARRAPRHQRSGSSSEMDGRDGLYIGIAQALALVPGVSRSGATISAGLLPRLRPRRRRALLVPALGPGRRPQRPLRAAQGRRSGQPLGRRRRSSRTLVAFVTGYAGDRLAAALPRQPLAARSSSYYRIAARRAPRSSLLRSSPTGPRIQA